MEMVEKGNGLFVMGNGLDRQQRLLNVEGMDVCVFHTRRTGSKTWSQWWAEAHPQGFASPFFTCATQRPTMRKAVADAVAGARKPLRLVIKG